jgi:alpha-mannosidase
MRISLLRGTTGPDHNADQGQHQFRYSLLPHTEKLSETTVSAAYALNDPLIAIVPTKQIRRSQQNETLLECLLTVDSPNIVIETVKRAEDGNGMIVRMYESLRKRGTATLTAGFKIVKAWRTNLLEDNQISLDHTDNQVQIAIKPFEIITLRLIPGR